MRKEGLVNLTPTSLIKLMTEKKRENNENIKGISRRILKSG